MWVIGVEVEQETSAPPPQTNPGSAPAGVSSENIQHEIYHVLRRLKVLRLRSITKCQASSLAGLGKSVTQFGFSFAVAVWSGVNIAGVNLKDLNSAMGGKDDPEKWEDIHKKVINR